MQRKLITTAFFLISSILSIAQSGDSIIVRDLETWSAAALEYKINKKWDITLEQQLRLKDNSSVIDVYLTEVDLQYALSKPITLGFVGRYIRENDNEGKIQGYENHFRGAAYLSTKHDLSRLTIRSRIQYQIKNELGVPTENGDTSDHVFRLKIGSDYNIKNWKLDPKLSGEIFKNVTPDSDFSKFRITVGTSYKLNKQAEISGFYRMEKQLRSFHPKTTNIIGAKFVYSIK